MLKMWKNMKLATKITLIACTILFLLVAGWFSGFIPNLILDHYRSEYAAMPKDPATGFPSLKDRTESGGMSAFMSIAYWFDMSQNRNGARDIYQEAMYRYGWEHPRGPELWMRLMELRFGGANADPTENDAVTFYWLYAIKYNEKYAKPGESTTFHPAFATYEPMIAKMVARRGGRVLLPTPDNDYELNDKMEHHKNMGAGQYLRDFMNLNRALKINKVDLDALGGEEPQAYLPLGSKIENFSIKDWE